MASSPPFLLEDQTDEDFFDRLVNDDDDFKVIAASGPNLADGNVSDEVKAFANLRIGEVGSGFGDSGFEGGTEVKGETIDRDVKAASVDARIEESVDARIEESVDAHIEESSSLVSSIEVGTEAKGETIDGDVKGASVDAQIEESVDAHIEESSSLVSSNSFGFDSVVESNNGTIETEVPSDSIANKSSGSASSGVKEVQWSAFSTDLVQNGSNAFGSYSDFFTEFGDTAAEPHRNKGDSMNSASKVVSGSEEHKSAYSEIAHNYTQYQEGDAYGAATEQSTDGQDLNSSQYWENLYPGWKYDPNTGQWYQVEGYDATANVQGNFDSDAAADWAADEEKSKVSYLQQTTQSAVETVADSGTTESVTNWNQDSQVSDTSESVSNWNQVSEANKEYPSHMVFDPQYPGWYYDMIAQEWRSLDTYTSLAQSTAQAQDQLNQNGFASTGTSHEKDQKTHTEYEQVDKYGSGDFSSQVQNHNWAGSFSNFNQQGVNTWQPDTVVQSVVTSEFSGNQQSGNHYGPNFSVSNHDSQRNYGGTVPFYGKANEVRNEFSAISGSQGFVPGGNFSQQFNQPGIDQNEYMHAPNDYYGNQNSLSYSQQPFQSGQQFSYDPAAGRSSAGRPPHALVAFGFGGKLIVMKDSTSLGNSSYRSQDSVGGSISVLNLIEVVNGRVDASSGSSVCDYFRTLCRQSFPGPLAGGSVGIKELNKWVDERIAHSESSDMDYRKGEVLRLLFSLLKIACQHYGKLRSPFGTDSALKESDIPEAAVARLFASAKRNGAQFSEYGALAHCLQKLPPEGQMRATAAEVQTLLVSGRKKEALHCAQEGQLWGPALVLAAQLGDKFYVDTVKQMALRQLVAGSPMRTLCLLIAGQPADVFSTDTTADSGIYSAVNMSQQPVQLGANSMLDDWEENLAVITANRTKDDELVLIHLGDCLWKERSEIIAAHICYLVAEANFEPYSDSARLCLVGADHWKFPRTYASPEAIQRTEIYEYSMVLGNSQFILLPFQPYKLIYAYMLAEVGRVSDSLKYCQAVSKSLKTGRAPEVEVWRQLVSSLEERIRTHQQGGFSTNLAPAKLVGKLLNLFDSTAHRVVGGLPPPVPSTSVGSVQSNEQYHQSMGARVSTSQSTMAMSSLMPSASMEPISEWAAADGNRRTMHSRSVSEPDFGRSPRQDQVESSKETTSASALGKTSVSGSTSRFGRFGFGSQLLQKTVGLVLKPRQDKQAKLGEKNKFYYDENLKRWVEEGADPPAEEAALPPPPTTSAFPNGTSDYNLKNALRSEGSLSNGSPEYKSPSPRGHGSGIPPIPPTTSNQFSARGRMGVRSRYVDTFNQGGGNPTNLFHSPSVPSIKTAATNPKFFVPTAVAVEQPESVNTTTDSIQPTAPINKHPSVPTMNDPFQFREPSSSTMSMPRFASMDNISNRATTSGNGSLSSLSRRTASWSGSFNDAFSPSSRAEVKPLGEVLGMPPSSMKGGSYGDLQEVEL